MILNSFQFFSKPKINVIQQFIINSLKIYEVPPRHSRNSHKWLYQISVSPEIAKRLHIHRSVLANLHFEQMNLVGDTRMRNCRLNQRRIYHIEIYVLLTKIRGLLRGRKINGLFSKYEKHAAESFISLYPV